MKLQLKNVGGMKVIGDAEGVKALRDLLDEVLSQGYGLQSDGTLPEVQLVDEKGRVQLPARKPQP